MSFTVEYLEYFILILIRVTSMVAVAPFFNGREVPRRIKVAIALFFSFIITGMVDYTSLSYQGNMV